MPFDSTSLVVGWLQDNMRPALSNKSHPSDVALHSFKSMTP